MYPALRFTFFAAILTLLAVCSMGLSAPAFAATGTGTFSLSRTGGPDPAASATWNLSGSLLAARAEAPLVGVAVYPYLTNTDSRYVSAQLTAAERAPKVTACEDGTGHDNTTTITMSGVSSAASAFETDLVLNLLHGTGHAMATIAKSPYQGAETTFFAPGLVTWGMHSTCYDSTQDGTGSVPAIDGAEEALFNGFADSLLSRIEWPLHRTAAGGWHMTGTRHFSFYPGEVHTVTTNLTFSGGPVSMHALCYMPTVHDLRAARTFRAAKRIMARASFKHVHTSSRRTRAARKGRFYVREGVGNANPIHCGSGGLHLVRSLGWS